MHEPGWSQRFLPHHGLMNTPERDWTGNTFAKPSLFTKNRAESGSLVATKNYDTFLPVGLLALATLFNPFSGTYGTGEDIRQYSFVFVDRGALSL